MEYTKNMILALADEYIREWKKTVAVPHYYKRKGKLLERSYPDYIYTERYKELCSKDSPLKTAKIFKSSESGEMLSYSDLEVWVCDFDKDYYISSAEYEEEMGDDL